MNCRTIFEQELHEKYLLAQLDEYEKAEYENHVKSCAECQETFENNRKLVSGLRHIGRLEMKSEIQRQIEAEKARQTGGRWVKLARIAAIVFLFVVTPSVYFYYTKLQERGGLPKPEVPASARPDTLPPTFMQGDADTPAKATDPPAKPTFSQERAATTEETSRPDKTEAQHASKARESATPELEETRPLPILNLLPETSESKSSSESDRPQAAPEASRMRAAPQPISEPRPMFRSSTASGGAPDSAARLQVRPVPKRFAFADTLPPDASGFMTADSLKPEATYRFSSGGSSILLHFVLRDQNEEKASERIRPAKLLRRETATLELTLLVGQAELDMEPSQIWIEQLDEQTLVLHFAAHSSYRIDLREAAAAE